MYCKRHSITQCPYTSFRSKMYLNFSIC
jgi:hypothetical protein